MNDIFGKLQKLGMEIISVANVDSKGRIVIPKKIRKNAKKYTLHHIKDIIILKKVKGDNNGKD